jgi:hypothetical protein
MFRRRIFGMILAAIMAAVAGVPGAVSATPAQCFHSLDIFPDVVTRLRGDVDGDRRADTVLTRARWIDDSTCTAQLVVRTDRETFKRAIDPISGSMIAPPGLTGLIKLDRRPGLEIGVVVWLGASTGFMDVYALRGGTGLVRLSSEPFDYAGSLVQRSGVDCARTHGSLVVSSHAVFRLVDNRYHVTRDFYADHGSRLVLRPALQERARVRFMQLNRFPEFASAVPFPSCTVVAGSS